MELEGPSMKHLGWEEEIRILETDHSAHVW